MTSEFDAIGYVQRLEASGVPRVQAQVHARALTEVTQKVASKDDLRHEVRACEERLILRIELVKTELSAKIDTVKTELSARITELNAKIDGVKTELNAKIDGVSTDLNAKIDTIHNEMVVHRWLLGILIGINTTILFKIVFP